MGITLCAATASSVLTINVVLTVFASIKYGLHDGFGTLQECNCHTTKDLSLWLHLAINVLSTLLLGASNYCMQCLTSPTREEIDKAHGQHVWLDFGVPSVRIWEELPRLELPFGIFSQPPVYHYTCCGMVLFSQHYQRKTIGRLPPRLICSTSPV